MWLINVGVPNGAFNLQSSEKNVPSLPFSPKADLGKCSLPLESTLMLAISFRVGGQLENHAARFLKMICMVLNCEVELKAVRKHVSNTTNQLTSEFPLIPFISTPNRFDLDHLKQVITPS